MIKIKLTPLVLILFLFLRLNAQQPSKATEFKNENELKSYIAQVQKQYNIPGLAVAIIKNGKVIYKTNYGHANVELSVPVTDKTLFPLFSTSKVISVVAVYQLVEQKKITLENYISDFITDLPDSWKNVQIKNLITHSSGLPDIVNYSSDKEEDAKQKVYKDTIKFEPGNRFDYNQTNYWLINRIFQKVVGKTLSEYIMDTQFHSSLGSVVYEGNNMKVVQNLSYGYLNTPNSNQLLKRNWSFPEFLYGAAALNMTLNSFIEWNNKFDNGELISDKTKTQLFTAFNFKQPRDFTYGLEIIRINNELSYGFSGGISTAYRKFIDRNLTIILLANGMFIPTDKLNGINEVVNNIVIIAEK
ncbi:MAG: serine hydrolase domain-containing protein [Pelobium sp.]